MARPRNLQILRDECITCAKERCILLAFHGFRFGMVLAQAERSMRSSILLLALSVALGNSACSEMMPGDAAHFLVKPWGLILLPIESASGRIDLDCVDKHARSLMKDYPGISSVSVENTPTQKILASNPLPDDDPGCYRAHYTVYARNYEFRGQYDLMSAYICVPQTGKAWSRTACGECEEWTTLIDEECAKH